MIDPNDIEAVNRAVAELREGCNFRHGKCWDDTGAAGKGIIGITEYSPATDIAQAWELVEEMKEACEAWVSLTWYRENDAWTFEFLQENANDVLVDAPTAQAAICLSWLKCKGCGG